MELNFFIFMLVGFLAQIIDGALGMGYGVTTNSILLGMGLPPAVSSATVHTAEIFTTGVSGFSHWKFKNINKKIFLKLLIPGVIGGVVGAYILSNFNGNAIKPFVTLFLLLMGVRIIYKALKKKINETKEFKLVFPLGLIGGFFDAIGGGGWGPIVTTTLVASGNSPRHSIGSVNAAEFFVTLAESITFILTIGLTQWQIILGLLLGGIIAAPLAAYVCKKLPPKPLMIGVGALIIILSLRTLYLSFF